MTPIWISLAAILLLPLMAMALVFAVGAACGVAAYHWSRQAVVSYQPMRKAFDPIREKTAAAAKAAKQAQEAMELEKAYLGGLQLTREQYLGGR